MSQEIPEDKQSRFSSLIGALKKLLLEDPIIFIVVVAFILPLATITYNAVVQQDMAQVAFSLGASFVVVILMLVPLIIVRTRRSQSHQINAIRLNALSLEAERRLEAEKNKQHRFNDLMDAKIETLKAETSFILSQSDRHEKELLEMSAHEIRDAFQKRFDTIEISSVIESIRKQEEKYDDVLIRIDNLNKALETVVGKQVSTEPKIEVVDTVKDPDETIRDEPDYPKILEMKEKEIKDLIEEIKGGAKNYQELQKERDILEKRLEEEQSLNIKIVQENQQLESRLDKIEALAEDEPEEDKSLWPDPKLEVEKVAEEPKTENIIIKTVKSIKESVKPTEDKEAILGEALEVLDTLEEKADKELARDIKAVAEEPPPEHWKCKCGRINNLSLRRCRVCGAGQPVNTG